MVNSQNRKLGILVGGGPAPGINSVIGAASICGHLLNSEVIGIRDGFKWLMQGKTENVVPLDINSVSRIHFRGGSDIGIARANPTKNPKDLETVISTLMKLDINRLITIGGDDTLYSAQMLEKTSQGKLSVVHVPKTIDNDLALPSGLCTFGYQTARHLGVQIMENLMTDARTTRRWYYVVSMGRKAGHLALGIGKSAGATVTIIPEEFPDQVTLKEVVDILVGATIKRLSNGKPDGVALIAEGVIEKIDPKELSSVVELERDAHDNIRFAEISLGDILKKEVQKELSKYGIKTTIVSKNIGYELRCADPIPFDMSYTKDLGFLAARHVLTGGTGCMITVQNAKFVPIPFEEMLDPKTGKSQVRMVDVMMDYYKIAYAYMLRLKKDDFEDPKTLAKLAAAAKISESEFKKRFEYLVQGDIHQLADIGEFLDER